MAKTDIAKICSNGSDIEPPNFQLYWFATILLAVAFAVGLALYPPVLAEIKTPAPDGILFFGRFHPIVIHLPVGILSLQLFLELFCLRQSGESRWGHAALFALFVAALASVTGAMFGIFLANSGGYEGGNFFMHQALCLGMAVAVLIALFLRLTAMSSGGRGMMLVYRLVFLLSLGLMSIGAHFGANMVHGNKYLIQYAPKSAAEMVQKAEKWLLDLAPKPKAKDPAPAPAPTPAPTSNGTAPAPATPTASAGGDKLMFEHVILPILSQKCNSCHNEDKSKGDLRMDTHALLLQGGEDAGKTVIPGKPEESLAIVRIMLPADDDEHMPPDGKEQMTKEETELLRWWIKEGASATLKVADAKVPAQLKATMDAALAKSAK